MSARRSAIRRCWSSARSFWLRCSPRSSCHSLLHIEPVGRRADRCRVLILIARLEKRDYLASVEWDTLMFFAGLFVMVGALVKTGVVETLARSATQFTDGTHCSPSC